MPCAHKDRDGLRKRITIDITGLLEGGNHDAVQRLLDGLTANELGALARKVHGALYRKLERRYDTKRCWPPEDDR